MTVAGVVRVVILVPDARQLPGVRLPVGGVSVVLEVGARPPLLNTAHGNFAAWERNGETKNQGP